MTVSARIASIIKEKGITQKAVAQACGLTPSTVNTWINCNSDSIPSQHILPICQLLGVSPEELLGGEASPVIHVQEVIPDGYIHLDETERKFIAVLRELSWESQIVVMNTAISERRAASTKGDVGIGAGEASMG